MATVVVVNTIETIAQRKGVVCPQATPQSWHSRGVSDWSAVEWLTVPDVCERMTLSPGKVHRLLEERALLGVKIDGVLRIPELFLLGDQPHGDLRGTAVVLLDGGYSDEEAVTWLLAENDGLGMSPIEALRAGQKSAVRRLAQILAL